jgi:hypothetical protein
VISVFSDSASKADATGTIFAKTFDILTAVVVAAKNVGWSLIYTDIWNASAWYTWSRIILNIHF